MSMSTQIPFGLTKLSILGRETIILGDDLSEFLAADVVALVPSSNYAIFTDVNVANLHLEALETAFRNAVNKSNLNARVLSLVLPAGESSKTREMKAFAEDWLLTNKCTRDTCIIALGGGVIGDMVGFVAATFMRGVPIIQVPTTLLAMVDSSIGGKTAIDTPHGKNLVGAFHQPQRIFMDLQYLRTLPKREFVNGIAEVIKTAAIWSSEDFDLLENHVEEILEFANPVASKANAASRSSSLLRVILGSARVKAHVVTVDEKETGLRGLLNFGHTIGHAYEAILSPELLHGECVSIGMVKEGEISRHLGHLSDMSLGRLVRCLQAYGLPISANEKFVRNLAPNKTCPVDKLLDIMKVDKKNQGNKKRLVLLATIGQTVEPKASIVADDVIRKIISPAMRITSPIRSGKKFSLGVPGSKSISNRALILVALGKGDCRLSGLLHSDDVQHMLDALQKIVGITFTWENNGDTLVISGGCGKLHVPSSEIYLGNAGTASRFLTSICALIPQPIGKDQTTILTGNARMKQRPIGPLVDALRANGSEIKYLEAEKSLPLEITPIGGLKGGHIQLAASISSQYVSSVLMAAPYAVKPITLELIGDAVVSQPYIDMTIAMMDSFGIKVVRDPGTNIYHIPTGIYKNPTEYLIEADASSATYPLAFAAITGSTVTVTNIGRKSLQGDSEFAVKVLKPMGCFVEQSETTTTVTGPENLKPIKIDMETMTDAFLTASVLAGVAIESGNITQITGIANQRVKECDRIAAMVEQLGRFGIKAGELPDGIEIHGKNRSKLIAPVGGVKCFDDHRVAMSFSILASGLSPNIQTDVNEKKCVEKTWPSWWDSLETKLDVSVTGVEEGLHEEDIVKVVPAKQIETKQNDFDESTIILIGMRGVGKTSSGKALASALNRVFIDMDHYLEITQKTTIPEIIANLGWEAFRCVELDCLKAVLEKHVTGAVISCGGGIVETPEALKILKSKKNVIHIHRNQEDVIKYLSKDETRPSFGLDTLGIWNKRRPLYKEVSSFEFVIPSVNIKSDADFWTSSNQFFVKFVKNATDLKSKSPVPSPPTPSFFLSLTFPNIHKALDILPTITDGVDAVELRVDLLESSDEEFVGEQLALLRRYIANPSTPIIFTVRTDSQGGKFPKEKFREMFILLQAGIRWGCEFVDVEVADLYNSERKSLTEKLYSGRGNTRIIASYHDVAGTAIWDGAGAGSNLSLQGVRMKAKYLELYPYADIIKLIGVASNIADNFALVKFTEETVTSLGLKQKPLIALNMGSLGQLSRALNKYLTPITHPSVPFPAAPGQLSMTEITHYRTLLGQITATKKNAFFLIGSPIKHSMSPILHNAGFKTTGLPFHYGLKETTDASEAKKYIDELIANGTFGGASVTIPLKQDVISHKIVQVLTDSAKAIGAVNTIINTNGILLGENTDWIGIHDSILKRLDSVFTAVPKGDKPIRLVGGVIGAGGTARAACYALQQLECDEIRLYNRTASKAEELAALFSGSHVVDKIEDVTKCAVDTLDIFVVVATVPADAQASLDIDAVIGVKAGTKYGVLVDVAYKPRVTTFLKVARDMTSQGKSHWKTVEGIEILILQGCAAFELWTGRLAPRLAMAQEVYAKYDL